MSNQLERIDEQLASIASALRFLGNGNASTDMGAIENHAKETREGLADIAAALREGLGDIAEALLDGASYISGALEQNKESE